MLRRSPASWWGSSGHMSIISCPGSHVTHPTVMSRLGGIEEDQDLLAACVFDVIEAVDQEGDGEISKEEFVKNAMNCKFIFNMLKSKRT